MIGSTFELGHKTNPTIQVREAKAKTLVFHQVSVQKCGTHLLRKVLMLFEININSSTLHHFCCRATPHMDSYLCKDDGKPIQDYIDPKHKYFVLIRDPRDALLSYIRHMSSAPGMKSFVQLPLDQQIDIALASTVDGKVSFFPKIQFNEFNRANELKKANLKNVLFLRFEDLIQAHAGGSPPPVRLKVFKSICKFAGINPTKSKIQQVMKDCWGDSATFNADRPKKVGEWKRVFQPYQIKAFKEKYNHLLLDLGYETDPEWDRKYLAADDQAPKTSL